jgi:putative methionine-R-sulfoxide reductase with GAF domain
MKEEITKAEVKTDENSEAAIPDKVLKPETEDTNSKTPPAVKKGEFKEKAKEAIQGYFGKDITDDNYDGMVETLVTDATEMKEKIGKYDAANRNILAMMESEPELSGILADMSGGAKFSQVLPKYIDLQALLESKGGDESVWEENNKTRMSKYEQMQAHKAQMAANEEKSIATVNKFMADKKLEGENADAFGNYVAEMIDRANSGDLSEEFLEAMFNAMNYKRDVAMAEEVGEVAGRNASIEEKAKSEEEIKSGGDKVPVLKSGGETPEEEVEEDTFESRFEKRMKRKPSILKG